MSMSPEILLRANPVTYTMPPLGLTASEKALSLLLAPPVKRLTHRGAPVAASDAGQLLAAIVKLRKSDADAGFVVCDSVTGARLGNMALHHDGHSGEVSYWVAAEGRRRGAATRALALFSTWSFHAFGLQELWLRVHRDNIASRQVAMHAGYRRDPGRDESQKIKGGTWP